MHIKGAGLKFIFAIILFALLATSCRSRTDEELGTPETPLVFVMSKSTVIGKEAQIETLRSLLEKECEMNIRIEIPHSPVRAIQLFGGKKADFGILPPFEFLLAQKIHNVDAGLRLLRDGPTYKGTILVKEDSGIESLENLGGKRIAYTDPYSMTGFVLPAAKLSRAGIEVDAIFAGTHDNALQMLKEGRVHAAATYLRRNGEELVESGIKIIDYTGPVPNEPVFFRKDLPKEIRQSIMRAFSRAAEDAECSQVLLDVLGSDGFAPVTNTAYEEIHKIAREAGLEVQSLVPGGWFVYHTSREPFIHIH